MITEDYVSFETAKLLKEKGFDVYGDGSFNSGIEVFAEYSPSGTFNKCITSKPHHKAYPAPTLQMAMKWLREVHKIYIVISPISGKGYGAILCDVGDFDDFNYIGETDYFFHPEEAIEAGIKYALENLI